MITQVVATDALPQSLRAHHETLVRLGAIYKQLNAPFGAFGMRTLAATTRAIQTGAATSDTAYSTFDASLAALAAQRDALAAQIKNGLSAATFGGQALNERQAKDWIDQAQSLIDQANALAAP